MDESNMAQLQSVDVPTLLNSIARQLSQTQDKLNDVDGAGTHGQRIASAFSAAARGAANANSNDAGEQLMAAAQTMRQQGQGKATTFYANGLEEAAQSLRGQQSVSGDNLMPFLQSFLGGIERDNPAQPGQGTMLDAVRPAVSALSRAQQGGQPMQAGLLDTLGAAITGTQNTAQQRGRVDPGAASATNVIGGIITAVAPTLIGMLFNRGGQQSGGMGGMGGGLGGLLGGLMGGGQQAQPQYPGGQSGSGGGDLLGGLLGGLMGGGGNQGNQGNYGNQGGGIGGGGSMDWIGGLLGGLMGGGGNQGGQGGYGGQGGQGGYGGQQPQGQGQGIGLDDILGGLMGGGGGQAQDQYRQQPQPKQDDGFGLDDILGGFLGGGNDDDNSRRGLGGMEGDLDIDKRGRGGSQGGNW